MRESRTPGSVRGVLSNEHPYRDGVGSADSDPDPRSSTHDPLAADTSCPQAQPIAKCVGIVPTHS